MTEAVKKEIGARLRAKREAAGYTREELGELCSLSPRFIANIEFGDSAFSLDTLMTVCRVLSCSADSILFGDMVSCAEWSDTVDRIAHMDIRYKPGVDKVILGMLEIQIGNR